MSMFWWHLSRSTFTKTAASVSVSVSDKHKEWLDFFEREIGIPVPF
jgi:hypothetical protein